MNKKLNGVCFYTAVRNTKAAKTDKINTFTEQQYLDSGLFGSKVENAAFVIRARTDINPDARPSMYLDCYGTGGVVLFLDTLMSSPRQKNMKIFFNF